jgi:hypothetical protein
MFRTIRRVIRERVQGDLLLELPKDRPVAGVRIRMQRVPFPGMLNQTYRSYQTQVQ